MRELTLQNIAAHDLVQRNNSLNVSSINDDPNVGLVRPDGQFSDDVGNKLLHNIPVEFSHALA